MTSGPQGIRLAIVDDNPFIRDRDGAIHPVDATFHRFAAAVATSGAFSRTRYLIPVRPFDPAAPPPALSAVDTGALEVVPTRPFGGAADYLRRTPLLTARNWPIFRRAIGTSDLVWIKVPASNALLAAAACRVDGVARFTYVAGSVRQVIGGQRRGALRGSVAGAAAILYDSATRLLTISGASVHLDEELFTSVIEAADVAPVGSPPRERSAGEPWRIAWSGRVAGEKGLDDLIGALRILRDDARDVRLLLIGDGVARPAVERTIDAHGMADRVEWTGYLGDRSAYLTALRRCDVFVLPSRAEGLPKSVVEAMAIGLPVIATGVGSVPALLGHGTRGVVVGPGAESVARGIARVLDDAPFRTRIRDEALRWAADHTADAQARRLVAWMRASFPTLAWPGDVA